MVHTTITVDRGGGGRGRGGGASVSRLLHSFKERGSTRHRDFNRVRPPGHDGERNNGSSFRDARTSRDARGGHSGTGRGDTQGGSPGSFGATTETFFTKLTTQLGSLNGGTGVMVYTYVTTILTITVTIATISTSGATCLHRCGGRCPSISFPTNVHRSFYRRCTKRDSAINGVTVTNYRCSN